MECLECQSSHVNKNGHKIAKDNYIYVDYFRQFIDCINRAVMHKNLNVNVSYCM